MIGNQCSDDKSINELAEANAVFVFPSLTINNSKSNIPPHMMPDQHTAHNSLLFTYETQNPTIEYTDDKPIALVYTFIIVNLYDGITQDCPLITRLVLSAYNRKWLENGILPLDFVGSYMSVPLHRVLLCFTPEELRETNCHGDGCRNEIYPQIDGIWCTACHGDFGDYTSNLRMILKKMVCFSDIPRSSIVSINQTRTHANDAGFDEDLKAVLDRIEQNTKAKIADLRERIESSEKRIKDIIGQKEKDQLELEKLLKVSARLGQ